MLKKQFLKTKKECKVTFTLQNVDGETAALVGEFNHWDGNAHTMKKAKDGSFSVTVNLPKDQEFQFRYLVNGDEWHNDPEADKHIPNPHGEMNSVVVTSE
jgi:1,4-alpha-glucan branching enzyme